MDHQSITDGQIKQLAESCRPGSSDLASAEFAPLADRLGQDAHLRDVYERIQRVDTAVQSALADVAIPAGLGDRILAGLNAEAVGRPPRNVIGPDMRVGRRPARFSRRRLAWASAALAASLLAAAGLRIYWAAPSANLEDVLAAATKQLDADAGAWKSLRSAPAELPPLRLLGQRPRAWRPIKALGTSGAAYDLSVSPRERAVLLVLPASSTDLPTAAPAHPQLSTGGQIIGAWQSRGLVYVLMVIGPRDRLRYRSLTTGARGPLA